MKAPLSRMTRLTMPKKTIEKNLPKVRRRAGARNQTMATTTKKMSHENAKPGPILAPPAATEMKIAAATAIPTRSATSNHGDVDTGGRSRSGSTVPSLSARGMSTHIAR